VVGGGGLVTKFIGGLMANAAANVSSSQQVFNNLNIATLIHYHAILFSSFHSVAGCEHVHTLWCARFSEVAIVRPHRHYHCCCSHLAHHHHSSSSTMESTEV
jgi:hypothetical protein